jgi:hypothetical protein
LISITPVYDTAQLGQLSGFSCPFRLLPSH